MDFFSFWNPCFLKFNVGLRYNLVNKTQLGCNVIRSFPTIGGFSYVERTMREKIHFKIAF